VEGAGVKALQLRFLLDWTFATGEDDFAAQERFFPPHGDPGPAWMLTASSGPDALWNASRDGYLKLVNMAQHSIFIQTPYFVPDESLLTALHLAAVSGVDVRVMIPARPDHPFVHWASLSYLGELLESGARGYLYEGGFLHAKAVAVDDEVCSVGSANWDVRSFRWNFECNALLFDRETTRCVRGTFERDLKKCQEVTWEGYRKRGRIVRGKEFMSRLFAPVL
jgi:cardiolipin synthase